MWAVVEGVTSPKIKVDSGVSQGAVLGLLLFLLFIKHLPKYVSLETFVIHLPMS